MDVIITFFSQYLIGCIGVLLMIVGLLTLSHTKKSIAPMAIGFLMVAWEIVNSVMLPNLHY